MRPSNFLLFAVLLLLLSVGGSSVHADVGDHPVLHKPSSDEFLRDAAGIVTPEDRSKIQELVSTLREDKKVNLFILTINTTSEFEGFPTRLMSFARQLFDHWLADSPHKILKSGQLDLRNGYLFIIAKEDQRCWIETGPGQGTNRDQAYQIIENNIVPYFNHASYSRGVLQGVTALDKLARDQKLPAGPWPWGLLIFFITFGVIVVLTTFSFIRTGRNGMAWQIWSVVLAVPAYFVNRASAVAPEFDESLSQTAALATFGKRLSGAADEAGEGGEEGVDEDADQRDDAGLEEDAEKETTGDSSRASAQEEEEGEEEEYEEEWDEEDEEESASVSASDLESDGEAEPADELASVEESGGEVGQGREGEEEDMAYEEEEYGDEDGADSESLFDTIDDDEDDGGNEDKGEDDSDGTFPPNARGGQA